MDTLVMTSPPVNLVPADRIPPDEMAGIMDSPLATLDQRKLVALAHNAAAQAVSQTPDLKRKWSGNPGAILFTLNKMKEIAGNPVVMRRIVSDYKPDKKVTGLAPGIASKALANIVVAKATAMPAAALQEEPLPPDSAREPIVAQKAMETIVELPAPNGGASQAATEAPVIIEAAGTTRALLEHATVAERDGYLAEAPSPDVTPFHELPENAQYALARHALLERFADLSSFTIGAGDSEKRRDLQTRVAGRMLALHEGGKQFDEETLEAMPEDRRGRPYVAALISRCVDCAYALSSHRHGLQKGNGEAPEGQAEVDMSWRGRIAAAAHAPDDGLHIS